MTSQEFLNKKLKELNFVFTNLKIRYEYRKLTSSHIVEVLPFDIFEEDERYLEAETELEEEFEGLFPKEDIIFVSEDSLTEIRNADLILGYDVIPSEIDIISNVESLIQTDIVSADFNFENYSLAA